MSQSAYNLGTMVLSLVITMETSIMLVFWPVPFPQWEVMRLFGLFITEIHSVS